MMMALWQLVIELLGIMMEGQDLGGPFRWDPGLTAVIERKSHVLII